jgi:hypothetical protein
MKWVGLAAFLAVACATTAEPETASITGRYLGYPPGGQVINLHTPDGPVLQTATDQQGRFSFEGLEPGMYVAAVETEGLPDATERSTVTLDRGQTADVVLGIIGSTTVGARGVVRMRHHPVRDVEIEFRSSTGGGVPYRQITGPTGEYEILLEQPGEYLVSFETPAGVVGREVIRIPDEREFVLDLEIPGAHLSGRARWPDGRACAAVPVRLVSRGLDSYAFQIAEAQPTQDGGRFRFEHLPAGDYVLGVDEPYLAHPVAVSIRQGEAVEHIDLPLTETAAVVGTVKTPEGEVVPYAMVIVTDETGLEWGSDKTDREGRFEIGRIPPGDVWVFTSRTGKVDDMDWETDWLEGSIDGLFTGLRTRHELNEIEKGAAFVRGPVTLGPGETRHKDLTVQPGG